MSKSAGSQAPRIFAAQYRPRWATASDVDGIARVEFYEGSRKLGEDTTEPYELTWNDVGRGVYRVSARAVDTLGAAADSPAAVVTVTTEAPVQVSAIRLPAGGIRLNVTAPAGNHTIEDAPALTGWGDAFPLTVGAGGAASVDDTRPLVGSAARFYWVRKN